MREVLTRGRGWLGASSTAYGTSAPPGWFAPSESARRVLARRSRPTRTTGQISCLNPMGNSGATMLEGVSAITLATHDMACAVAFYEALGFVLKFGGPEAAFTSFHAGTGSLNLTKVSTERQWSWWGRAIFYVTDVDAQYARACSTGLAPTF